MKAVATRFGTFVLWVTIATWPVLLGLFSLWVFQVPGDGRVEPEYFATVANILPVFFAILAAALVYRPTAGKDEVRNAVDRLEEVAATLRAEPAEHGREDDGSAQRHAAAVTSTAAGAVIRFVQGFVFLKLRLAIASSMLWSLIALSACLQCVGQGSTSARVAVLVGAIAWSQVIALMFAIGIDWIERFLDRAAHVYGSVAQTLAVPRDPTRSGPPEAG